MDKNKILLVGLGLAGLAYFLFFKDEDEQTTGSITPGGTPSALPELVPVVATPNPYSVTYAQTHNDPASALDTPLTGTYQGTKPRSTGNSNTTTTTVQPHGSFAMCIPAMESEGGGKGKFISIDDPYTPGTVEAERRQLMHENLNVGDTIDLDGRSCKIKKFWVDGAGRKSAINCENHNNITYNSNSKICWS